MTEGETTPNIAYPGITAECILGSKNIYEIVWNCGGFSAQFATLSEEKTRSTMMPFIEVQLSALRERHREMIFITDADIYATEEGRMHAMFTQVFGRGNYAIVTVETASQDTNPVNGLRMNRTRFSREQDLVSAIAERPDAVVVSSIPKSDPRIDALNTELQTKQLSQSFAARSLQLLGMNASKMHQLDMARDLMGYIGRANTPEELQTLFQATHDAVLVLKGVEGVAGGTDVNFLANPEQKEAILSKDIFPVLVYQFLMPTRIVHVNGKQYATQFRPALLPDGSYV